MWPYLVKSVPKLGNFSIILFQKMALTTIKDNIIFQQINVRLVTFCFHRKLSLREMNYRYRIRIESKRFLTKTMHTW